MQITSGAGDRMAGLSVRSSSLTHTQEKPQHLPQLLEKDKGESALRFGAHEPLNIHIGSFCVPGLQRKLTEVTHQFIKQKDW